MRKSQGSLDTPLIECVNPRRNTWRIRFNLQADTDGGATWLEEDFDHQPAPDEIKALFDSWSSNETARLIREGLTYGGHLVWLSQENQLNYKMIHDTAVQSGGQNLPVRIKLGSDQAMQVDLENDHFFSYRARAEFNSEDKWNFPTRGIRFKAVYAYLTDNFASLDGQAGMSIVSSHWRVSIPLSSRLTLQPMVYGRLLLGNVIPPVFGNTIGGDWFGHYVEQQMPFAGIGNIEYVDHQFVAAQLKVQQRFGANSYVLLRLTGAQQADKLKALLDHRTLIGGQVAYYYNTMFGPVGASLGYSNRTKEPYFYINLGYEF